MKSLTLAILTLVSYELLSQPYFSRVYTVPEDGTGLLNVWPNYLRAVFPTDSLIYSFGYSADTTYKQVDGTGFFVFNTEGTLLEYYHIKDSDEYNFFYPEGIHTWDGITFYTSFNNFYKEESILKFNRFTKQQEVLKISNSVILNGDILRGNMVVSPDGCLFTASDIAIDSLGYNYKIQVTKIDTQGKIKWQTIIGKEPINVFINTCYSSFADNIGNVYVGVNCFDYMPGTRTSFQSSLYKLDSNGVIKNNYNSKLAYEGFHHIYDITQDAKGWLYLSSNYNFNGQTFPFGIYGYGVIQILDSNLNFKGFVNLNYDTIITAPEIKSYEKVIKANGNDGILAGGLEIRKDFVVNYIDSLNRFDTSEIEHYVLTLLKINKDKNIEWKRHYRIRNGYDNGWLWDIKSFQGKGYVIGAQSFEGLAYEKFKEPYYMPWLLRVDDDGCLIPGCGTVSTKDQKSKDKAQILVYPNPASNYIVILHPGSDKTHYQVVSADGKLMDEFYSLIEGEQIIVPVNSFRCGRYFVKAESKSGISSQSFIKQ
jgi:hypothetical protein